MKKLLFYTVILSKRNARDLGKPPILGRSMVVIERSVNIMFVNYLDSLALFLVCSLLITSTMSDTGAAITKDGLVAFGFVDNTTKKPEEWMPDYMTKDLVSKEWRDEHSGEDNAVLELVLTGERNVQEFGLRTSDGILYLNFATIEDIERFEKCIQSYSPNC